MLPRPAPVCDWCGYAPQRVHRFELLVDRRQVVSLLLCRTCNEDLLGRVHDAAERAREARGRAARLPAFAAVDPEGSA